MQIGIDGDGDVSIIICLRVSGRFWNIASKVARYLVSFQEIQPEDWRSIIQKDPMENTSTTHDISQDQYSFQVQGVVDYTWKKNLTIG